MTRLTVLAGGVGGARFLRGLREAETDADITAIVNTGDDVWLAGLRVCPDLDSIMYTLGGANDEERGWGRTGESERVSAELNAYGVGWPWFTLGDLDLGTHIARLAHLRAGLTLTEATARLCERWRPGVTLLPMSDDEVETWVVVDDPEGERAIHFEEWWVRHRASLPVRRFEQRGVARARPAPGVLDAIARADAVILAPSNPVVSIDTILGIPGIRDALASTHAPVVGVSPIIGGAAVRGMADACLRAIGVATEADAVARHYGTRARSDHSGVIDGWLVDTADEALIPRLEADGIRTRARPLRMSDVAHSAAIAAAAVELARQIGDAD